METEMDLERRLRALPAQIRLAEADEAAIARLAAPPKRRDAHRRRPLLIPALAGLMAALIGGNGAASYFAPRYAAALASAPALGVLSAPALRWAGLSASSLTFLDDSVTVNGHRIRLIAGRADELRTVLFLEIDGVPPAGDLCLPPECTDKRTVRAAYDWGPEEVTLTDQFGHSYARIGNESFEPLTGPAASVGARLTLTLQELTRPPVSPGQQPDVVAGVWTLHATLLPQPAPTLALPPPMQFEGNTYRITSARTDGLAVVHFTVTGPAVEQWRRFAYDPNRERPSADPRNEPGGQLSRRYFDLSITGPDGRPALTHEWGYVTPRRGPLWGEATFVATQPGTYRIRFGAGPEASLVVPPATNG